MENHATQTQGTSSTGGRRKNLRDGAYQKFLSGLTSRTFRPGRLLSQMEISEATGSSITAVREALKRLEGEKVVELIPQKGVLVREIGADEIRDIYQLRKIVEVEAIKVYMKNPDFREITELHSQTVEILGAELTTREMRAALVDKRRRLDRRIHRLFSDSLKNDILNDILSKLETRLLLVRMQLPALFLDRGAAFNEHLEILEAIQSGGVADAVAALESHLDASAHRATEAVEY